jgi:ABC-type cobalamin/Fe3+-siderophores transport system ATPase subunit
VSALVEFHEVAYAYPAAARQREGGFSLAGVSFAIEAGEVFGVIGPNSAGKTTLLRLLTRVLSPGRGEVRLDGRPVHELAHGELARRVAVVPQDAPRPFPFSVEQLVLMGRYPHGPERYFESAQDRAFALAAMRATGVAHLAALPLEQLSGGERSARCWRGRWPSSRRCSCSTSRPRTWTCATRRRRRRCSGGSTSSRG